MTIRASLAKKYGAEDPADSLATAPVPWMDWLKERGSMFSAPPIGPLAIKPINPQMESEGYYKAYVMPGVTEDKRYSTCYGFNCVINAHASKEKQDVLHHMYRFIMSDLAGLLEGDGAPHARAQERLDGPSRGQEHPEHPRRSCAPRTRACSCRARRCGASSRTRMHRAVQKVMLANGDIKTALNEAAAEVDRATAELKKG